MNQVQQTLGAKVGPLPVWGWAGIAAVVVWFVFLRGKGSTPAGQSGTSPTGQATTDYSLGYAQGLQSGTPGSPQPAPGGLTTLIANPTFYPKAGQGWEEHGWSGLRGGFSTNYGNMPLYRKGSNTPIWIPHDAELQVTGQADKSGLIPVNYLGQTLYAASSEWSTQSSPTSPSSYAPGGGKGGPASARKFAVGSRRAAPWHDGHPDIGQRVLYPHYVNVGGPAGGPSQAQHRANVRRVARQSGVHTARVLMLNPIPSTRIRVA